MCTYLVAVKGLSIVKRIFNTRVVPFLQIIR